MKETHGHKVTCHRSGPPNGALLLVRCSLLPPTLHLHLAFSSLLKETVDSDTVSKIQF
jgi:hypothetical protein